MAQAIHGVRVRLVQDTRHGKEGSVLVLPREYAEALIEDCKAVAWPVESNKSLTHRGGIELKGGTERNR